MDKVAFENAQGAIINIEMPAEYVTTGTGNVAESRFALDGTNNGVINVKKGVLTENASGELVISGTGVVYVEKEGDVALYDESGVSGWIVLNDKEAGYTAESTTPLNYGAYSVKKVADLANVATLNAAGIKNVFIDADLKITTDTSVAEGNVYVNASQSLGADFTTPGHTYFVGNVTLSGEGTFAASGANTSGNLYVNGTLTLGDKVILTYQNMPNATDMSKIKASKPADQIKEL